MFLTETETPVDQLQVLAQEGTIQNKPVIYLPERYWKVTVLILFAGFWLGLWAKVFKNNKKSYSFNSKNRGF